MKKKFMSVPIEYTQSKKFEADDLKIPVEILVMHDKKNANKSNFEMEAIEQAKESIKNIPILGYIKKIDGSDAKDFAGHEMELSIKDGELKLVYLERPIGVIPESNNYEYVEVDGKTYVKVTGFIWKEYLNEGYEILQENPNKSVSMEITVDDYTINKDGIVDITSYRYLGVTILGDSVSPGMEGANMQVVGQFSEKFSEDFYEKVEKLNMELKSKFSTRNFKIDSYFIPKDEAEKLVEKANSIFTQLGFECVEYVVDGKEYQITGIINKTLNKEASENWGFDIYDKDTITIHSLDFETIDSASISISSVDLLMKKDSNTNQQHFTLKINNNFSEKGGDNLKGKNNTKLEFSATYRQKRDALCNALDPIIVRDKDDRIIEETYYWVSDFDDEMVYLEKSHWTDSDYEYTNGRVKYTFDETTMTATVDMSSWENMILTWVTEAENQEIQNMRNAMSLEVEGLKVKVVEFETIVSGLKTENEEIAVKSAGFESTIATITEQFNVLKDENQKLQEYKNTNEFEADKSDIESTLEDFEVTLSESEEFTALKKNISDAFEKKEVLITLENLEKELFAMVGKLKHKSNVSKTRKQSNFSRVSINVDDNKNGNESYYGDAVKYIKK